MSAVRVVTDSASMITPLIRDPYRIGVVPIVVVVDGKPYREGVELAMSECYEALGRGAAVTTSAPSPGELLACYESVAREGAQEIVSVHTGSRYSAVVDAARIASGLAPVPVHVVDTASAAATAASAASGAAACSGSVCVVGAAELALRGGRFASTGTLDEASVLGSDSEGMRVIGRAARADDAIGHMVGFLEGVAERRGPLCVAVGDAACRPLADATSAQLANAASVAELLRYEVGPSVVAHTGLGTIGAVFAPVDVLG